jgi:DNA repair exonuclease SbcCD nuclease subunit
MEVLMASQSIRFLHAGGFQLHSVFQGLPEAPESLLELLVHAPFRAAEQVIQAALREEVDFVLLSGDLLDAASGGPRGVAFLLKQFEVLHDNGIPVFWAASPCDLSSDWLNYVQLPDNVHRFSRETVEHKSFSLQDQSVVTIHGRSWNPQRPLRAGEFSGHGADGLQIAVLYGPCDLDGAVNGAITYWAGGGVSGASTTTLGKQVLHCPGWSQGLSPAQSGAHGCTLVHIDSAGDVRMRRIEADVVRWADERVTVSEGASLADVRNVLRLRAQKLLTEAGRHVVVKWTLCGEAWFDNLLMDEGNRNDTLNWLREEFGQGAQLVWSVSLEIEPPSRFRDEWVDEDSILGDYLRTVQEFMEEEEGESKERPLTLDTSAALRQLPGPLAESMSLADPATRVAVLREAALLGVDLLRGDERPADVRQRALEAEQAASSPEHRARG